MSIDCESEARYALQGTDNTESSTGTAYYGLGLTPADERIGGAQLTLGDITLDGGAAYRTSSTNSGETWSVSVPSTSINITRVNLLGYTNMQGVATGPAPIKALRGTLSVNAHIVPAKDLTLTEDVQIEGSATISLLYL